jgi:hypothetical protein
MPSATATSGTKISGVFVVGAAQWCFAPGQFQARIASRGLRGFRNGANTFCHEKLKINKVAFARGNEKSRACYQQNAARHR